jgi:hypothetical protein
MDSFYSLDGYFKSVYVHAHIQGIALVRRVETAAAMRSMAAVRVLGIGATQFPDVAGI